MTHSMKCAAVVVALAALLSSTRQSAQSQSGAQPQSSGQEEASAQPQHSAQPPQIPSKGCLAVRPIGSHAIRNIMLAGVAGALISEKQYRVVDLVDYPGKIGQKLHGNDLQTLQTGGIKVVILDKKYSRENLQKACH